jgi:hypothetical protein
MTQELRIRCLGVHGQSMSTPVRSVEDTLFHAGVTSVACPCRETNTKPAHRSNRGSSSSWARASSRLGTTKSGDVSVGLTFGCSEMRIMDRPARLPNDVRGRGIADHNVLPLTRERAASNIGGSGLPMATACLPDAVSTAAKIAPTGPLPAAPSPHFTEPASRHKPIEFTWEGSTDNGSADIA